MNSPREMMVLANEEDTAEVTLFESVGFEKMPGQKYVTVTWILPAKN